MQNDFNSIVLWNGHLARLYTRFYTSGTATEITNNLICIRKLKYILDISIDNLMLFLLT